MCDTMDEIDKKIISALEKNKGTLLYIEDIHEQTGINKEIIQDRVRHLYTTKRIFPFVHIYHCNACLHADIYTGEQADDIFCKLLNKCFKCFKHSEHIPKECPLRTEKYYVELFVE